MSETATQDAQAASHPEPSPVTSSSLALPPAPAKMVRSPSKGSDEDAQAMLITSLRSQVQDLFTQVTQLNGKLVASYDRVSDLEDVVHVSSSNLRQSSLKVAQLELERTQHLSALNAGLLVEKSHVTSELTRLMEKATEEAARRGKAESARAEIEKDLDDLSASLFDQANTMVAQARISQATSDRKVAEAEAMLRGAEDAVGVMQQQMQGLQSQKEKAEQEAEKMRATMGKGKWIQRSPPPVFGAQPRLMSSHTPYQEFLSFVAHLRTIRPASHAPPAMSTLLALPLLTRLQTEDSDPTVRLDLAPSLNWLSRRSVLAAIHTGELNIEPMSSAQLVHELSPSSTQSTLLSSSSSTVCCSLCGTVIFASSPSSDLKNGQPAPPVHPIRNQAWSTALFKNPITSTTTSSPLPSPPADAPAKPPALPAQVFIFRLSSSQSSAPLASLSQAQSPTTRTHIYPLCPNSWCLRRLRATCSLWAFVRGGIIEKVWEEEQPTIVAPVPKRAGSRDGSSLMSGGSPAKTPAPPVPPRRRSKIGGIWSALGNAISNNNSDPNIPISAPTQSSTATPAAPVAVPPPQHPDLAKPQRNLPPPLSPRAHPITPPRSTTSTPPPPPPRNSERSVNATPPPVPRRSIERGITPPPAANNNGPPVVPVRSAGRTRALSVVESVDERSIASGPPANDVPTEPIHVESGAMEESNVEKDSVPMPPAAALEPDSQSEAFGTPMTELTADPMLMTREDSNLSFVTAGLGSPPQASSPELAASTPVQSSQEVGPSTPTASTYVQADEKPRAPSRTASPAVGSSPVSRTGSPAPPPIPRRAAARARPSSIVATAPPIIGDANGDAKVNTSDAAAAGRAGSSDEVKQDVVHEDEVKPDASTDAGTLVAEQPTESVAEKSEEPTGQQVANEGTAPSIPRTEYGAPLGAQTEANGVVKDAAVSAPANEVDSAPQVAELNAPAVNGRADADESKEEVLAAQPNGVSAEDAQAQAEDGEVYVGHATWEERAWTELTRLREEMFWARVGGCR